MIVVDIELSEDTPTKVCDYVVEKFPFNSVDHKIEHTHDGIHNLDHILIELAQDDLTPEQEQHLNLCEYVREYNTREGNIEGAYLDKATTNAVRDLLTPIQPAYSGDGKRVFYSEDEYDQFIISLQPNGTKLQQVNYGDVATVTLNLSDTDRLLAILLQHKIKLAKDAQEAAEQTEEVDGHPF